MEYTEAARMLVGAPVMLVGIVLTALLVALPVFVWQASSRIFHLLKEAREHTRLMKVMVARADANNALLRQLLRAYGHEPGA
jgi:hypothetical protein